MRPAASCATGLNTVPHFFTLTCSSVGVCVSVIRLPCTGLRQLAAASHWSILSPLGMPPAWTTLPSTTTPGVLITP